KCEARTLELVRVSPAPLADRLAALLCFPPPALGVERSSTLLFGVVALVSAAVVGIVAAFVAADVGALVFGGRLVVSIGASVAEVGLGIAAFELAIVAEVVAVEVASLVERVLAVVWGASHRGHSWITACRAR